MTPLPTKPRLKESFIKDRTIGPIYTGGAITLSLDGSTLYSAIDDEIVIVDVESGNTTMYIKPDCDTITSMAVQQQVLVVATRSLQLIVFDCLTGTKLRSWKGHEAPVLVMDIHKTASIVATGSADATVKVWDITGMYCSHNFKGHSGIVSAIKFHDQTLVSGGEDGSIIVWDLFKRTSIANLKNHVSVVRGLAFLHQGQTLVSAGRDKVVCVWDMHTYKIKRVVPVYDALEAVQGTNGQDQIVCAGEKGQVYLIDIACPTDQVDLCSNVASKGHSITHLFALINGQIATVTSDHNIVFLNSLNNFERSKQIVGYNDEVIDLAFVGADSQFLAVATNSPEIKIFNTTNNDSELFAGHDGIVFCLAGSKDGQWLLSGSKDKTAKLWHVSQNANGRPVLVDIGTLTGHTESVGAVTLSNRSSSPFAVTGSQDRTLKIWDVKTLISSHVQTKSVVLRAKHTVKAHDKDINSVAVSPNDRLVATASQDKLVKLWCSTTGQLLGELKGHKRGVWRCTFSPVDQILATASADKTVKLWNVKTRTCMQTFEGHLQSVLNVVFVAHGCQLMTSGGDGLVKLWTVRSNECVATLDAHTDRVWALTVRDENVVVSGGADSVVQVWQDSTEEEQEGRVRAEQELIIKDQDLSNYLAKKDYKNAILLALSLNKPYRLFKIVEEVMRNGSDENSICGSRSVDLILESLSLDQVSQLIQYIRDWNTHAKTSTCAQVLLSALLKSRSLDALMHVPDIVQLAESIVAYSERHLNRLDQWATDSYVLDYTVHAMSHGLMDVSVVDEDVGMKRKR